MKMVQIAFFIKLCFDRRESGWIEFILSGTKLIFWGRELTNCVERSAKSLDLCSKTYVTLLLERFLYSLVCHMTTKCAIFESSVVA